MSAWADSLTITREDSADLGLLYAAFWARAVTADEVTLWLIDLAAERTQDVPTWLTNGPDEVSHPMELDKALDFVPDYDAQDTAALEGIAWLRDTARGDVSLGECTPRPVALAALRGQPDLTDRLARVIPQAALPALQDARG